MKTILLEQADYILPRYRNFLKKHGIDTIQQLFEEYPTRYENYKVKKLSEAKLEEPIVLEGSICSKVTIQYLKSKLSTVNFLLEVDGQVIKATLFNRVYLKNKLDYGTVIKANGKFLKNFNNFTISDLIICDEIDREIVPIYKNKDVGEAKYLEIMDKTFRRYGDIIEEFIPLNLLEKHDLIGYKQTLKYLHNPNSLSQIDKAVNRLKYQELLTYQVSMKYLHYMRENTFDASVINYDPELLKKLEDSLDYELTNDQKTAISDILKDLKAPYGMNRLLQGEVGSGKTIVAVMAILAAISDGYQAALMCPTEILSNQHFETISQLFKDFDIKIELLTGSTSQKNRKIILENLKNGTINLVIGTHALFQKDVEYDKLGIVIADEEHRFGVKQRVLIRNKGEVVNYLKMSATPIPRTLSISAYGDMDISIIKEMPKNRKPVITKFVSDDEYLDVIKHMKEEIKNGHQIYVVTPLINESENLDTAAATEIFENMSKYFNGDARIGLVHGRLKSTEKEEIMKDFLDKKIDILVATSVIEVGVNVLNATTIVILGAERFGVATLHQLRGRVMRSDATPYCFLLASNRTETVEKRLKMVEETTDGFLLAEYDLINRGPGEFFGEKQSGTMNFKFADLKVDNEILIKANDDADEMLKSKELFENNEYKYLLDQAVNNYHKKLEEID